MILKAFLGLLKDTFDEWTQDNAARLGAALAYYALFSIAPVLIIVVAVAGLVFGEAAAQGKIVEAIQGVIGADAANVIQSIIQNVRESGSGLLATIIGLVTIVLGASGLFSALKDALNAIWEIAPSPDRGLLGAIRDRILAIVFVLGIGFLLMAALAVSTAVAALSQFVGDALPGGAFAWQAVNFGVLFAILTVLFAMIYRILPDARIAWRDTWIGALFTSLLFTIGIVLLGLYLGRSSVGSTYGAAGSLVVILIWVYYSAQIFFFGAEFAQVYANKYGSRLLPDAGARRVVEAFREPPGAADMLTAQVQDPGQPEEPAAAPPEDETQPEIPVPRPSRERVTAAAIGAGVGILGGILISILGPLIGLRFNTKKKQNRTR